MLLDLRNKKYSVYIFNINEKQRKKAVNYLYNLDYHTTSLIIIFLFFTDFCKSVKNILQPDVQPIFRHLKNLNTIRYSEQVKNNLK